MWSGRFVFSIQDDRGFAAQTGPAGAAQVLIREGEHQVAGFLDPGPAVIPDRGPVTYNGVIYQAYSFTGQSFTGGPARISYLVPPEGVARECGPTPQATILNTVAGVSVGIYQGELLSHQTLAVRDLIAQAPGMLSAVRRGSPAGVRAGIVKLFRTRLHIVRVRVTAPDGSLINDVGGPAVLAPVGGDFRGPRGQVIGHFLFSVQDDAGYLKLVRAFTGAKVLMLVRLRAPLKQLAGDRSEHTFDAATVGELLSELERANPALAGLDPRRARAHPAAHQRVRERRARRGGHGGRQRRPGRRPAGDLGRMRRR